MGTCVSKCCINSSPPRTNTNPPQDKLVISQSQLPPKQIQAPSPSSSSSYSSSLSASSNSLSSVSSTSFSSSSSSCPSVSSKRVTMKSPDIIILDPHKYCPPKPKILPSKRERSSSPQRPTARHKSLRSENKPVVSNPSRALSSKDNGVKDSHRLVKRNEKVKPLSACNSQKRLSLKVVEDLDNPLISMECFIFL